MEWKLFADLAERAGDRHLTVDVEPGERVEDALHALLDDHDDLRERVLDEDGQLSDGINVLRNGSEIHTQQEGLETTLEAGDELAMFPPVSGG
ncbi:MoaD family protein [Halovivax asiaticus JCM 14624]|uniref:MoaD family protein n=1 Tax=Halovivax asiaticus JCM 14624 TaxID=1227490 RepID=M0BMR0_9EURY|nr:ubiquitin-like small modifier protein 1 [Halovivax asiaticus]ELZ12145.1 MoaD family protein [Halovivax asiaticus JCM 14624]